MALEEKPAFDLATDLAKVTIIRRLTWLLAEDGERISDLWENYPEIGEDDWIDICRRLRERHRLSDPTQVQFDAAYAHLAERAEH